MASETVVFDEIKSVYPEYNLLFSTTIHPGTINVISDGHINTRDVIKLKNKAHCLFEFIYFMDKKSELKGKTVGTRRYLFGKNMLNRKMKMQIEIINKNR